MQAAAQHLDLGGDDLDLTGGKLGVFGVALPHDAFHGNGGFLVERLDDVHHLLGVNYHLRGAVKVADHDKGEVLADDADVFHPADDADLLARVREPQLPAVVGSVLGHS